MITKVQKNVKLSTLASVLTLVASAFLMVSKFSNEYTDIVVFLLYDILPVLIVALFAIFIAYFAGRSLKITFIPLALSQITYIILSLFYYSGNLYGKKEFNFVLGLNEIIFDLAPFVLFFMLILFFVNEIKSFLTVIIFLSVATVCQIAETIYSYITLGRFYFPFFSFSQILLFVTVVLLLLPENFELRFNKKVKDIEKAIESEHEGNDG